LNRIKIYKKSFKNDEKAHRVLKKVPEKEKISNIRVDFGRKGDIIKSQKQMFDFVRR
jgi:hypothetical protein